MFIHQKADKYDGVKEKWINADKILFIIKKTYDSSITFSTVEYYECYLEGEKEPIKVTKEIIDELDELMVKTKKVDNADKEK